MNKKINFEDLPDGSHIITVTAKNLFGQGFIRQERIGCLTVWEVLKERIYTAQDMGEFSVWAYDNGWYYGELTEGWYHCDQTDDTKHTIEEVLKMWEDWKAKQRGESTE